MFTQQFFKGLAMLLVTLVINAFSTPPIVVSVLVVTAIGSVLVYVGVNAIPVLRPISIPGTLTARDVFAALLVLIGNAIINATGTLAVGVTFSDINWLLMGKLSLSVALTYLGSTLFAGPYSTKEVSWSKEARLAYNKKAA